MFRHALAAMTTLAALGGPMLRGGEVVQAPAADEPKHDGDRYFVIVFGAESSPKRARFTHTWATMVKASPETGTSGRYRFAVQTISWMPRTLVIRPLALRAECGVNLSLEATLRDSFCKGLCVALWGPYEYDPELAAPTWERVRAQIARLNSGCVLYKCVDPYEGSRSKYMSNCIHAVSDLDRYLARPSYNELRNYGQDASRRLVDILASRHRFDREITHPWVADALGIDARVVRHD